MKKIFLYLMLLLATDSLFSQSNELCILQNPNTNNVEIRALSGFVEQPTVGQSFTMGGPRSPHGSFYTYDRGAQTISQLKETGAANVLFFLYDKTIGSGTISSNDIVKATASETIFNDATTSIEISVGDVFSVCNATLGFYARFKLQSYDTESDDYTFEIVSSLIPIKIYYDDNCVIPETVYYNNERYIITEIAKNAFAGCTNLTSVTIPSTVTKVGEKAFSGCTKLTKVTCLSTTPPEAYSNSFVNYNGYLYIPCDNKDDYEIDVCWGSFKHIECIGSETVELTKDEVAVAPEKNEAVFSMPKNENANSYTLTISNNGVTFCTLTFNAQGQLANIDFSTNKSYELKSGVEAFQFTVTGLSTAEDYGYSFKALASNKSVLKEYTGTFTTKNEDGTGGSVQGGGEGTLAVEAVSNSTAVTVVNAQILVNGEAPAFVVTVSGQKIANANLKAGVYFAVVDGEMVGVSVR